MSGPRTTIRSERGLNIQTSTQTVIYRSKRHHTTKRNFEIFKAPDFIAAVIDHLPPKGHQTVRYYGLYSNKTRGRQSLIPDRVIPASSNQQSEINNPQSQIQTPEILLVPAPPKQSARSMRPLWRDLILKVWGADPLQCPCCKAPMKLVGAVKRPEQIEFFLRLHGLWEGIIQLPRPPPPPFDIEKRRRLVGVLDGGEAVARRVSPPGGAGESNHGADRTTLAGDQGMDCRRSALAMQTARSSSGSCFSCCAACLRRKHSRRRTCPGLVQPSPKEIAKRNLGKTARRDTLAEDDNRREISRVSRLPARIGIFLTETPPTDTPKHLFRPLFPRNPLFPASGPATRSFDGLHPKSKFLAIYQCSLCGSVFCPII